MDSCNETTAEEYQGKEQGYSWGDRRNGLLGYECTYRPINRPSGIFGLLGSSLNALVPRNVVTWWKFFTRNPCMALAYLASLTFRMHFGLKAWKYHRFQWIARHHVVSLWENRRLELQVDAPSSVG